MADTSGAFNADGSANTAAITAMMTGYGKAQGRSDADLASTAAGDAAYWVPKVVAGGPSQLSFWQGRMQDKPGQGTNAPAAQQQQSLPQQPTDPSSGVPTIAPVPTSTGVSTLNSTSVPLGLQGTPATQQNAINTQMSQ